MSLTREAYAAMAGRRVDAGVSFRPGSAVELARSAAVVRSFESVVDPSLLRTPGYAAAARPLSSGADADRAALLVEGSRRFTFVVAEGALRTWPGSGECMPEQLTHRPPWRSPALCVRIDLRWSASALTKIDMPRAATLASWLAHGGRSPGGGPRTDLGSHGAVVGVVDAPLVDLHAAEPTLVMQLQAIACISERRRSTTARPPAHVRQMTHQSGSGYGPWRTPPASPVLL